VSKGEKKAFLLRLDPDLWAKVQRMADADLRSVNGQIEYLLLEAVRQRLGAGQADDTVKPLRKAKG
jgi:hypothetical protein